MTEDAWPAEDVAPGSDDWGDGWNDEPYPSNLLTDICKQLLEWPLSPEQIANLAADIPGECEAIEEARK